MCIRDRQYIHFDAGWYGFEYDKSSDATTVTLDPRRNEQIEKSIEYQNMGADALLEIAFDGVGTKRLMANTASQHMKKL